MKIDRLILGEFETNCFVLRNSETVSDCVIIDTGLDSRPLLKFLQENNLNPAVLVLTHGHIDHIAGVEALRKNFPSVPIYIHKLDAQMLTDAEGNLSVLTGSLVTVGNADHILEEDDLIDKASIKLKVLHTPGHTPGGISLYCQKDGIIFVGDTLFAGSIGRTDFPNGNTSQLISSIRKKLLTLPENTIVYPGHGPETTIGHEKAENPFLS